MYNLGWALLPDKPFDFIEQRSLGQECPNYGSYGLGQEWPSYGSYGLGQEWPSYVEAHHT
jgi:hypothetical protein